MLEEAERLRRYRRHVYESGGLKRPDNEGAGVTDEKVLEEERAANFNLSRIRRFRYRTRYFTDSGIIGTRVFVAEIFQRFKHLFQSKTEKEPTPVRGIDGLYSLKRLSENI